MYLESGPTLRVTVNALGTHNSRDIGTSSTILTTYQSSFRHMKRSPSNRRPFRALVDFSRIEVNQLAVDTGRFVACVKRKNVCDFFG